MKHHARQCLLATLAFAFVLAGLAGAQGTTWYVDVAGDPPGTGTQEDPFTSIQYAISRPTTISGDFVLVLPGTYLERIDFLGKGITVRSRDGATQTILDGQQGGSTVTFVNTQDPDGVLWGFTIRGGTGTPWNGMPTGGGVYCEGTDATITECRIVQNSAARGGGLASIGSFVTLIRSEVVDNVAETAAGNQDGQGGGIFTRFAGGVSLVDSAVVRNTAGRGGGIYSEESGAFLQECIVDSNVAYFADYQSGIAEGGGIFATGSSCGLSLCLVINNRTVRDSSRGGGLSLRSTTALILISSFVGNAAGDIIFPGLGGGIAADELCQLDVEDSFFRENRGERGGAGVYGVGNYFRCTITGSIAQFGGGVHALSEAMRLTECDIVGNYAASDSGTAHFGGGVYGPAHLERCEVSENVAIGDGGGAWGATLVECSVRRNRAFAPEGAGVVMGGGAVQCTLTDCTIQDNVAVAGEFFVARGGGVAESTLVDCEVSGNEVLPSQFFPGPPEPNLGGGAYGSVLTRCTLFDNFVLGPPGDPERVGLGGGAAESQLERCILYANAADRGGGVANCDLDHCTLSNNEAPGGGGGAYYDDSLDSLSMTNSILWSDVPDEILDLAGVVVRYSDVQGGWPGVGNIDADPLFVDPRAGDFRLRSGSPCIDAADPASTPDPDGTRADMGALPFTIVRFEILPALGRTKAVRR